MRKTMITLLAVVGFVSTVQAASCPEANYDGCASDGYSIVEAEPNTYWPHQEMESAHSFNTHKIHYKRVRVRVHRSWFKCSH